MDEQLGVEEELEFEEPLEEDQSLTITAERRKIYTEQGDPEIGSLYNRFKWENSGRADFGEVSSCSRKWCTSQKNIAEKELGGLSVLTD